MCGASAPTALRQRQRKLVALTILPWSEPASRKPEKGLGELQQQQQSFFLHFVPLKHAPLTPLVGHKKYRNACLHSLVPIMSTKHTGVLLCLPADIVMLALHARTVSTSPPAEEGYGDGCARAPIKFPPPIFACHLYQSCGEQQACRSWVAGVCELIFCVTWPVS